MAILYQHRRWIKPASPGFGTLLRSWRELRGYTTERIAERAGLDRSTISRLELGQRRPDRETVMLLADALDLSGTHRVSLFASCFYIERPLTDAQVSALAADCHQRS